MLPASARLASRPEPASPQAAQRRRGWRAGAALRQALPQDWRPVRPRSPAAVRSRSRRTRGTFGLQLGQLIVLQLDQALQLVQLTLQIGHAAFQFSVVTTGRIEAFLGHRQLVAQGLGIARGAFATGLAGLGGNQAQIVLGSLRTTVPSPRRTLGGIELLLPVPGLAT